jgi:hypothetical protein
MNSLLLLLTVAVGGQSLAWDARLGLVYDDNLYDYSAADLDSFMTRSNPARFPMPTSDDLDATVAFAVSWRYRVAGRSGTASFGARQHQFASNHEKSYGIAEVGLGLGLWSGSRLRFEYKYMPNYLVRYYRRSGSQEYVACRFAEHLAELVVRQRFGPVVFTPGYRYEVDDYIAAFEYYDTRAHRPGIGLEWEAARSLTVALDYEFKLAVARGPIPDISYRQHEAAVRLIVRPLRSGQLTFEAECAPARREFSTTQPAVADPDHAGRVDWIYDSRVEARYRLGFATLVLGCEREWRAVVSAYRPEIVDVKDYRSNRISLGLMLGSRKAV